MIDGDISSINEGFLIEVSKKIKEYEMETYKSELPVFVISIIGPQSTGKSTLVNSLFGTNFQMSAGRCTRGMYAAIKYTNVETAQKCLILDSEGLLSIQKDNSKKFDHLITTMAMILSNIQLVNVKGEMGEPMKQIIGLALHSAKQIRLSEGRKPLIQFVLRDMNDINKEFQKEAIQKIEEQFDEVAKINDLPNAKSLIDYNNENSFSLMMPAFINKQYPDEGTSLYEWNEFSDMFR